jgi:transposase-like protein
MLLSNQVLPKANVLDKLPTLFEYPAAHWIHLRTTNAIESTFGMVKARARTTKGAGSRQAGLAMAFKLLLVALVQAGVKFPDGKTRILPDAHEGANQAVLKDQEDAAKLTSIHNI